MCVPLAFTASNCKGWACLRGCGVTTEAASGGSVRPGASSQHLTATGLPSAPHSLPLWSAAFLKSPQVQRTFNATGSGVAPLCPGHTMECWWPPPTWVRWVSRLGGELFLPPRARGTLEQEEGPSCWHHYRLLSYPHVWTLGTPHPQLPGQAGPSGRCICFEGGEPETLHWRGSLRDSLATPSHFSEISPDEATWRDKGGSRRAHMDSVGTQALEASGQGVRV